MRTFLLGLFGSITGLILFTILFFVVIFGTIAAMMASFSTDNVATVPNQAVLFIDLTEPLPDQTVITLFGPTGTSLVEVVRKLDAAQTDDRVKGLFIRANPYGMSPAVAEELRLSIKDFQTAGKFVIVHAQGFEGTSPSNYMAVSAADTIYLQDTTTFSAAGYRAEVGFLGGVFEKFDAKADFVQFYEYKSMGNIYTEETFTEPHRESTLSLITSLYDTVAAYTAEDRAKIATAAQAKQIFEGAPYSAERALELGLVDELGHYHAAREAAKTRAGEKGKFMPIADYDIAFKSGAPVIAVVGGQGAIVTGDGGAANPFSQETLIASDTMSEALTKAADDKNVKAIIIRVDSPGGSAIASDQIWDAVNRAKAAGKPIIISMGQYAASGGYYIAAGADRIIALPTTITGSIGVVGGKIALEGTYEKVGYNVESLSVGGDYTGVYSSDEPWDVKTRSAYVDMMEDIYVDFTNRVANGRNIPIAQVREIAKGRVWTGEQAMEIGLIDEYGGMKTAIAAAKKAANIDADTKVRLRKFPPDPTPGEVFAELFGASAKMGSVSWADIASQMDTPEAQLYLKLRRDLLLRQDMMLLAPLPDIK
ncbi:signal peptide peptidase SppA [Robiginitomaculum antarcticum]|uniref:signal peptide peptidase SppA n=1 Tax=Robiginitomaculum antarcticum TaxID=437507 RepID=UPI00037C826C|nr:signal peptide peptidase SppA [Robiginitomaculum antarcticum]